MDAGKLPWFNRDLSRGSVDHSRARVESFNTFNHTQFQNVQTGYTNANFGAVTSTYDPRQLQFGGKFIF